MSKEFIVPLLNGIRWTNDKFVRDPRYNTLPFESEIDLQSYAAPIQQTDTNFPVVILLSDYPSMTLDFYVSATNAHITTIALVATSSSLIGVTFLQYIAYADFSTFPVGYCYGRIAYTDEHGTAQSWTSCPIDVEVTQPDTMLYEYQNSYNTKDVLFTPSNIILQMRVEANMVGGYQPKSQRETFDDQSYNPTLLNGIPFRTFTNNVGGTGIPDWCWDKLNLIFTLDQVRIDGTFYVATNGTDFKLERISGQLNQDAKGTIELQDVPDFEFGQLTAGTTPTGDLIVIRKVWPLPPFANVTSNFTVVGVFTINSTLDYLQVFNYGTAGVRDTFNMLLGTSVGLSDIASLEVGQPNADTSIDLISTHDIGHGFNVTTTIYVTIPNGVNIRCLFVYDQLDAPVLNPPTPGSGGFVQGTVYLYKELSAGYFTRDWNISTGLGNVGSLYEGCQILDELGGKYPQGWVRTTTDPTKARGQEVGNISNSLIIQKANLPAFGLGMFTAEINSTDAQVPGVNDTVARASNDSISRKDYEIHKGTIEPQSGRTGLMGAGAATDITPDSIIFVYFVKL